MNIVRYTILVLGLFCVAARSAPEKIETLDQLRRASVDVEVAAVDFTLPEGKEAAENALSDRYFNKPQEERFSGVTTSDSKQKWDLLATVLIEKAKEQKLDSQSLEACLKALNRGHTKETMLCVLEPGYNAPFNEKPADAEKRMREQQAVYDAAMKDRKEHPEKWESPEVAIPVAAYFGKHSKGSCWIIVCKWEDVGPGTGMGHIRIWAVDSVTHKTVVYVTCD